MSAAELLDLLFRWVHVIAGIMWIGNSLLYNWLDRNLEPKPGIEGEIWLLHSGAFYQVEKKYLEPNQLPARLHWFMWQNFTTWASGIALLVVVYYLGSSAWLVDPGAGELAHGTAVAAAVGALVGGWVGYDLICRSLLRTRPRLAAALCLVGLVAITWGLARVLAPRAAYIHVGVLLGTLMTGNVWTVIVPSQRDLVAATKAGRPQDRALGATAKQRSIHNNYMTFPLLFVMISNHFPQLYGHHLGWAILLVLMVGGALVRHFMNIRWQFAGWRWALAGSALASLAATYLLLARPARDPAEEAALAAGPAVPFAEAHAIVAQRCVACHSATPSDEAFRVAPDGVRFDHPEEIRAMARRIRLRVEHHTMPFANKTNMTQAERDALVRWVAQGARLD
jgi:uncharacterized membrane protein